MGTSGLGRADHQQRARSLAAFYACRSLSRSSDRDRFLFPVYIRPSESAHLAQPHTGIQPQQRRQIVLPYRRPAQRFLLGTAQSPLLPRFVRLYFYVSAGIFENQTLLLRKAQRRVQQAERAPDSAVRQSLLFQMNDKAVNHRRSQRR